MAKRVEAMVNSRLLVWARESAGLAVEQAARKASVKPQRLVIWERGEGLPTVNQLRNLAGVYRRPLAVFYLPEPPKDFRPMHDFRRFPGELPPSESPELRLEIRRAHQRRQIALELYEEIEGQAPRFSTNASLSDEPEKLAVRIRKLLGIICEDQAAFRDDYQALDWWRSAIENAGVLVFQARGIQLSEMRGFSISERPLPVVVANIKDSPRGRIFTLLHDFVHTMLRDGGLCDLGETDRAPKEQRVEIFCNRVAGAILVPKEDLLGQRAVLQKGRGAGWGDEELLQLARRYRASREVVLRRLLMFDYTTQDFYRRKTAQWQREYRERERRGVGRTGGPAPHRAAISGAGTLFIRLVLTSYYQENITASDLSDFLNVKLEHVERIEREVMGHSAQLGASL